MIPVFYCKIRPAIGQTEAQVILKAHTLGYELIPFCGWTLADFGTRKAEIKENSQRAREIQDICEVDRDWPHILTSQEDVVIPSLSYAGTDEASL